MSHALELPDLVAGDLMRPREHMRSLREGMTLETVLAEFSESRYSRYPGSMPMANRYSASCTPRICWWRWHAARTWTICARCCALPPC